MPRTDPVVLSDNSLDRDDDADEDYVPPEEETLDDETTMEAEEKLGRDMSYAEEIAMLQRENERSLDELRAMYAEPPPTSAVFNNSEDVVPDNGEMGDDGKAEDSIVAPKTDPALLQDGTHTEGGEYHRVVRETLPRRGIEGCTSSDKRSDTAESDREGMNASKAMLVTRPFLIPSWVKIREYQHVGLIWLVALQTRRLNGILADGKIKRLGFIVLTELDF
jgi:E1A-binding protein p400